MSRSKRYYSFGFDPGINHCSWAVVDDKFTVKLCGMIRNPAKKSLKGWDKMEEMIPELEKTLEKLLAMGWAANIKHWVCEGQYPGPGNPDHQTRNGWLSAIAYSLGEKHRNRIVAIPSTWTRNKPKELRHDEMLKILRNTPLEWDWMGDPAPQNLMHNVYDAVGLAIWGITNG